MNDLGNEVVAMACSNDSVVIDHVRKRTYPTTDDIMGDALKTGGRRVRKLDEVIARRLRQRPPEDCTVVPRSTQVIAFGRFRRARVATISLNPSHREFEEVRGERRFHTLETLGIADYRELGQEHAIRILDYCERYFERGIYYADWFDRVNWIVREATGADYFDGSACHLDISQWATMTVWSGLTARQRMAITSETDLEVVRELIAEGPYEILLLNGKKTALEVLNVLGSSYEKKILRHSHKTENGRRRSTVEGYFAAIDTLLGTPLGRTIRIFGWNVYAKYAGQDSLDLIKDWIRGSRDFAQHVQV